MKCELVRSSAVTCKFQVLLLKIGNIGLIPGEEYQFVTFKLDIPSEFCCRFKFSPLTNVLMLFSRQQTTIWFPKKEKVQVKRSPPNDVTRSMTSLLRLNCDTTQLRKLKPFIQMFLDQFSVIKLQVRFKKYVGVESSRRVGRPACMLYREGGWVANVKSYIIGFNNASYYWLGKTHSVFWVQNLKGVFFIKVIRLKRQRFGYVLRKPSKCLLKNLKTFSKVPYHFLRKNSVLLYVMFSNHVDLP